MRCHHDEPQDQCEPCRLNAAITEHRKAIAAMLAALASVLIMTAAPTTNPTAYDNALAAMKRGEALLRAAREDQP